MTVERPLTGLDNAAVSRARVGAAAAAIPPNGRGLAGQTATTMKMAGWARLSSTRWSWAGLAWPGLGWLGWASWTG